MGDLFDPDQVSYVVRTYLPIWRHDERLEELIRFCHETRACGVLLWIVPAHMAWNQATLDEARREAENVRRAKERLVAEGFSVGINSCYNFHVARWDSRHRVNWDYWATREDGFCDYTDPCFLDPKFEDYLRDYYGILARVRPDYIFIDDDHRYTLANRATRGCFCDLHLQRFGELTDTVWTRERLSDALVNDQVVRRSWIEFLGSRLVELAAIIRQSVHAVDPGIEVGMMMPCVHALPLDGHTLKNVLHALKGRGKPLVRPCVGGYSDANRRDIIAGLFYMEFSAHYLGHEVQPILEGETTPFTRLAKSMTVTRFQVTQGLLNRVNAVAISPCGYVGDSLHLEPAFADMLKGSRDYFETVRRLQPQYGTRKGIQFMWSFDSAKLATRSIQHQSDLYWPAFTCHDIFGHLGFPITYDESPVRLLAGDSVRAFSDERIREILSGGVLVEVNAARALQELGYGEYLGCSIGDNVERFGAEECTSPQFCGPYVNTYIPLKNARMDAVFRLEPAPSARTISHVTDPGRNHIAPGVVLFENELGGRVAMLPYNIMGAEPDLRHFICYHRRHMFKAIFDWMCRGILGLWVETPACFAVQVWDDGQRLTACATNVSLDVVNAVEIDLYCDGLLPQHASFVADDGHLETLADKVDVLACERGARWKVRHDFLPFKPFVMVADHACEAQ